LILSQISKLSYFNVLGLADFMMYHQCPVSFFALIPSHTCAYNMCFVSSFVINWQFKRIEHNGTHKPGICSVPQQLYISQPHKNNENFLAYFMRILNYGVVYKF